MRRLSVRAFTKSDADTVYNFMRRAYQPATWGRRIKHLRALFDFAISLGWIDENPFSHIQGCSETDRSRSFFVTQTVSQSVLGACPDSRSRLIFALARWGGLRIPSELALLKRSEIDWGNCKILVSIPKMTDKIAQEQGIYRTRWIPIFPEIMPHLREFLADSEGESDLLFPEIDGSDRSGALIRKQFRTILERAGVKPWPKLFVNLRSTRDSELQNEYPLYKVCYWLGHSPGSFLGQSFSEREGK